MFVHQPLDASPEAARSSPDASPEAAAFKNFSIFTGKHLGPSGRTTRVKP